jgi:hypothetical protein
MEVNTNQIQGSHGTVYGDCSLKNWWWIQQVPLKHLYIYSRLQGITSTISNLYMVKTMKSSRCVKMEFAANVSNTLGASVKFNWWLWVSWWVDISFLLSAQDNGNNDNLQNVGYELHLHMAHCLRRQTRTVTMKLQIYTTKFSPEVQV